MSVGRYLDRALIAGSLAFVGPGLRDPEPRRELVNHCACGRRISDNKRACYACALETENAGLRERIAELEALG